MKKEQVKVDKSKTGIRVTDLHKSFGDQVVLAGMDLEVFQGENVVVLGRSGSGKSVLIKIIAGLLKPDSGVVKVLGNEVDKMKGKDLQELRMKIGFSFQSSALYDGMTVGENLEFPLVRNKKELSRKQVEDSIRQVLDEVGLLQTIGQLPAELSGGQKKRIAIARMLVLKPEIILYDEPTGGLDPITSVEINNLINRVQQQYNASSVIITHDLSCAKSTGDRIVMLNEGKALTQGSFREVFQTEDPRIKQFYDYNFISDQ